MNFMLSISVGKKNHNEFYKIMHFTAFVLVAIDEKYAFSLSYKKAAAVHFYRIQHESGANECELTRLITNI